MEEKEWTAGQQRLFYVSPAFSPDKGNHPGSAGVLAGFYAAETAALTPRNDRASMQLVVQNYAKQSTVDG